MTWNLLHMARKLADTGGLANHGNDRNALKAGCRFDFDNPEHRTWQQRNRRLVRPPRGGSFRVRNDAGWRR